MKRILKFICILCISLIPVSVLAQGVVGHSQANSVSKPKTPKLTVNGYSESLKLNISDKGENCKLSISTNQGIPTVSKTPYWICVRNITASSMNLECDANKSTNSREGKFEIRAGKLSVTVYVAQPSGNFYITKCEFRNSTNYDYGNSLYASDIRYLTPRITYNGPGSPQSKTLYVKVFKRDGELSTGNNSPSGYTYKQDVTFKPGENQYIELLGWGNESSSTYGIGETRFEIFCDGKKIYTATVDLKKKPNESSVLKIDGQTYVNSSIGAEGCTSTYFVNTDAQNWNIRNIPDFCNVTDQTKTTFKLNFKPNIGKERTGSFYVETDNQKVTINVKQAAGSGMKINRVWTDYNVYHNGQKGMMIHVNFESEGLKGHKLSPCVFFQLRNGDPLVGYSNGEYRTPSGQTTVQDTAIASYENSLWEDFKLFMPYSQLPQDRIDCRYHVQIIDLTTDKRSEISEYVYFK